jgi:tRNA(Ile)-lysidine synthase
MAYCAARGVAVRADAMNEDESFSRVRVRRRLLPLLETFNPRVVEALARTAMLLRADAEALEEQAAKLLAEAASERELEDGMAAMETSPPLSPLLSVEVLRGAEVGLRRRALRQWLAAGRGSLRRIELVHVSAVEKLLEGNRGGRVAELPGGSRVERRRGLLLFHAALVRQAGES